jgi:hypothetical protein
MGYGCFQPKGPNLALKSDPERRRCGLIRPPSELFLANDLILLRLKSFVDLRSGPEEARILTMRGYPPSIAGQT